MKTEAVEEEEMVSCGGCGGLAQGVMGRTGKISWPFLRSHVLLVVHGFTVCHQRVFHSGDI